MRLFTGLRRAIARSELMGAMFERVGVTAWFAEAPSHAAILRRAAMRCASCGQERECDSWLSSHDHADHPPAFCRNSDLVSRIQRDIEAKAH